MDPASAQAAQDHHQLCLAPSTPGQYPSPSQHLCVADKDSVYNALQTPDFFLLPRQLLPSPPTYISLGFTFAFVLAELLLSNRFSGS